MAKTSKELQKLINNDLETHIGWIDPKGNFYPCPYACHNDKMDEIIEAGYDTTLNDCEKTWIKSASLFTGGHVFLGMGQTVTPKQKLTVGKLIVKHDLLKVGDWMNCAHAIVIRESKTKVKFERDR